MTRFLLGVSLALCAALSEGRAGLVIVQSVESEGQLGEITITIDGKMARVDLSPAVSVIIDGDTGEQITLMHLMREFLRSSAHDGERLAAELKKVRGADGTHPGLKSTGRNAMVGKYATDIYTFETGNLSATYWIATDFPDGKLILEGLETIRMGAVAGATGAGMPGPVDLPGVPVKTEVSLGGRKVVNTLQSVVAGPVDARIFGIPEGYTPAEQTPTPPGTKKAPAPRIP